MSEEIIEEGIEELTPTGRKKKTRVKKPAFDFSKAVDSSGAAVTLDEDGNMGGIPVNWNDNFDRLGKGDFAEPALYFEWKAERLNLTIKKLHARQEELMMQAKEEREGITEVEAARRKRAKLLAQLEDIESVLEAEGVSFDD